ncbi:hypothetical protein KSP39_PZI024155 [Platanthera zijinensis]|uniref:Reverse transcriptase domain-containing protein n=1 Tax=Platanthera zijinensis TaxID=2320716 RepID=A0AAP0AST2_9ASPA
MHKFKVSTAWSGFMAIKIDMAQAYNIMAWGTLHQVLQLFGLPARFINWVLQCVMHPRFALLLNGKQTSWIEATCGFRQGCPLSPYMPLFSAPSSCPVPSSSRATPSASPCPRLAPAFPTSYTPMISSSLVLLPRLLVGSSGPPLKIIVNGQASASTRASPWWFSARPHHLERPTGLLARLALSVSHRCFNWGLSSPCRSSGRRTSLTS